LAGDLDGAATVFDRAMALGSEHDFPDLADLAFHRATLELARGHSAAFRQRADETATIAHTLGDEGMEIDGKFLIAIACVLDSDYDQARVLLTQALGGALRRRRVRLPGILVGLAAVAAANDEPARAAQLLGASASLQSQLGAVDESPEAALRTRTCESVRTVLGDARFDEQFTAGGLLDAHAAADFACSAWAGEGRRSRPHRESAY